MTVPPKEGKPGCKFDPRDDKIKKRMPAVIGSQDSSFGNLPWVGVVIAKPKSQVVQEHQTADGYPGSTANKRQQRHGPCPIPRILCRTQQPKPSDREKRQLTESVAARVRGKPPSQRDGNEKKHDAGYRARNSKGDIGWRDSPMNDHLLVENTTERFRHD